MSRVRTKDLFSGAAKVMGGGKLFVGGGVLAPSFCLCSMETIAEASQRSNLVQQFSTYFFFIMVH